MPAEALLGISSIYVLKLIGGYLMEIFYEKKIEKKAYLNMYHIYSLSLQHDRYLCEDNYLSNPKKTYLIKRPLT